VWPRIRTRLNWPSMQGDHVVVTDTKGNTATVTTANVYQSNGVIHVVDKVLMP
jgi:uncharacterized surface protein with fasciclin (FAS1) repeats